MVTRERQTASKIVARLVARQRARKSWTEPEIFLRDGLDLGKADDDYGPYSKQFEMFEAVKEHRRVAVVGCNGSGKDWTTARIMLWWQAIWDEAITVVIGPTSRQVNDMVWKEARGAFNKVKGRMGGNMRPAAAYWTHSERRYAVGFATSDPMNIQGYHSPHMMVIVTEAHNVEQSHIDAAKRLNPERMILTGNPFSTSGEFYDAFHENPASYHPVEIGPDDLPNIQEGRTIIPGMLTVEDIEERAAEWGVDSPMYIGSIDGKFPKNMTDAIVSRDAVNAAFDRDLSDYMAEHGNEWLVIYGVDVARFGADRTVIYRRQGPFARKIWDIQGQDTQQTAARIELLRRQDPVGVDVIVVDDNGVGGGVTDRLRDNGTHREVNLVAFNAGNRASRSAVYADAGTESWVEMGRAIQDGHMDLERDGVLISQLVGRKKRVEGRGVLRLERKEEFKKRGNKSPDHADALAMTFAPAAQYGAGHLPEQSVEASPWGPGMQRDRIETDADYDSGQPGLGEPDVGESQWGTRR